MPTECDICNKTFYSDRSMRSHRTQVHININRDNSKRGSPIGREPWNKGKTKETDERVRQSSEKCSKTFLDKVKNGTYKYNRMSEDSKKRLSIRQSLRNSGGKSLWYNVNGISVQGTYERDFALAMVEQNILWEKIATNTHIFSYYDDNNDIHSYSPDFYLSQYDLYIEIKGYWWGNDEYKMKLVKAQHQDKKLVVIFGRKKLDTIIRNISNVQYEKTWEW